MIPGFYFDDDAAPGAIIRGLIREGVVVETAHSAGLLGADDLVNLRVKSESAPSTFRPPRVVHWGLVGLVMRQIELLERGLVGLVVL